MGKIKLGVIFGGMSTENEVSVVSANSILKNLDREKYEVFPIYIDKKGNWYKYKEKEDIKLGDEITKGEEIENIILYLKKLDLVFPVLHGLYGEDGTIQGLFELLKIPYVGCRVLASSIGMDKVYTKIVFDKAGIKQAKYEYIRKYKNKYIYVDKNFNEKILDIKQILKQIEKNLKYPMFIKPSNSGSSVGINKANNMEELEKYIQHAGEFDNKILIEEGIIGKEVECAVLGNEEVIASCVGEIKPAEDFYSYDAKYRNEESKIYIPANIPDEKSEEIRNAAIKAFKAIDGKGLSRVDFFIENETQDIYINEINTLPGFTNISMYPKLFERSGIKYRNLLNKIIELAIEED
ncbi:MAG: D-alanine--D-alanine ligase [Clostridia bacterium]|nr:D-alanine--D-alanine ligase [Clostridia bacterium]